MTTRKITAVAPEVGAALAAVDGIAVRSPETITDHLFPDLLAVQWDEAPTSITIPVRFRAVSCPGCGAVRDPRGADPLDMAHDDRCDLAAEEHDLLARDLRRLHKVIRNGRDHFHRPVHGVEADLLDSVGLAPATEFTAVHAVPGGGRRRTWRWISDEPALISTTTEEASA